MRKRAVTALACLALLGACSSNPAGNPAGPAGGTGLGGGASDGRGGAGGSAGDAAANPETGGAAGAGAGGGANGGPADTGPGDAMADGAGTDSAAAIDAASDPSARWPAVPDYAARGPYPTTRDKNVGPSAAYDVFRPTDLATGGHKHPIISWANGTLFSLDKYQPLLDHWASHGFVVVAAHTNTTAGGATHKAGIDWLLGEAGRAGSVFAGALDGKKIGAAGHSQGGGATIAAGSNKPGPTGIVATLPLMPLLSFEADKTVVSRQLAPMFNINATMDDRDPQGAIANAIFDGARAELVQGAFIGVHEDAMSPAMHGPTLAWFRLMLMNDQAARDRFYPAATCGYCQDPAWKQIRHKNSP